MIYGAAGGMDDRIREACSVVSSAYVDRGFRLCADDWGSPEMHVGWTLIGIICFKHRA